MEALMGQQSISISSAFISIALFQSCCMPLFQDSIIMRSHLSTRIGSKVFQTCSFMQVCGLLLCDCTEFWRDLTGSSPQLSWMYIYIYTAYLQRRTAYHEQCSSVLQVKVNTVRDHATHWVLEKSAVETEV